MKSSSQSSKTLPSAPLPMKTMRHLAFHDKLTGLANRVLLDERLRMAMSGRGPARRHSGRRVPGPRFVQARQRYLRALCGRPRAEIVGERLSTAPASTIPSRAWAGTSSWSSSRGSSRAASSCIWRARSPTASSRPIDLVAGPIRVTATVGLTVYREGEAPDEIISRADHAMYRARLRGEDGWQRGPTDDCPARETCS